MVRASYTADAGKGLRLSEMCNGKTANRNDMQRQVVQCLPRRREKYGRLRKDFCAAYFLPATEGKSLPLNKLFAPWKKGKGHASFSCDWFFQSLRKSAEGLGMVLNRYEKKFILFIKISKLNKILYHF